MWDAIVVGAGPAGCTAATLLAREGLRVALLDKSASPPPKVCGEYLSPGCLPILARMGALKAIGDAGARPLRGMLIHSAGGRRLLATYSHSPGAEGSPQYGLSIRRTELDPLLLDVALKNGAQFEPNFQVSDLIWDGRQVVGVLGRQQGHMIRLHARLVIGADGRNSVVARRLGRVKRHRWLDKIAFVGYLTGARRADEVGEIFLGRDRYCILNPIGPQLTNVGLVINRRIFDGIDPTSFLINVARIIPSLGNRLATASPIAPIRCLGPLAHRATRLVAPGGLLIGDAAGFLDPFTGEGIYAGLRSAELAVQHALPELHAGTVTHPELGGYAVAWSREILPKWRLCTLLQHAIRRPVLAEWLVGRLSRRPGLTSFLMAAVGDLLPPQVLSPHRFLPCLLVS